ncbi:MAG: permease [Candidatus Dormibacteria bacterium]
MVVLEGIGKALLYGFDMFWAVLWPLALGFLLSAVVETVVSKQAIIKALGRDSAKSAAVASALGAASSSCSYASIAVARSLFRKGATFANAIIFEFASTNLVIELGLVLLILLGWGFLIGELAGGVLMVILLAVIFRLTLRPGLVEQARRQADRGLSGKMEGHAAMDMSVTEGPFFQRLFSARAFTAISQNFFMNIASLWTDLLLGFVISGALAAWVPDALWLKVFYSGHGAASEIWGAFVGPLISVLAFVCSVGNVPLAAVLWRGGISFGGVIAFIFADLIIIPILDIYRKYYGWRVMVYLFLVSYATMVIAGLVIGAAFGVAHATPTNRAVTVFQDHPMWDYTTFLNIAFLLLSLVLGIRFLKTGGPEMLRMMNRAPGEMDAGAAHPA